MSLLATLYLQLFLSLSFPIPCVASIHFLSFHSGFSFVGMDVPKISAEKNYLWLRWCGKHWNLFKPSHTNIQIRLDVSLCWLVILLLLYVYEKKNMFLTNYYCILYTCVYFTLLVCKDALVEMRQFSFICLYLFFFYSVTQISGEMKNNIPPEQFQKEWIRWEKNNKRLASQEMAILNDVWY